jgi:ribonucleoside-diphosphate reductase subunit M2
MDMTALKKAANQIRVEPVKVVTQPEEKLINLPSSIQSSEADEPLLMENKQRFVLFPIKYHEVRVIFLIAV